MNHVPVALLACALLSLTAAPGEAQWVEDPGRGWVSLTVYHQDTRDAYGTDGRRGDFPGLGHAVASASYLTVAAGLLTGVDGWVQLSFQRIRFDDLTGKRTSTGVGDARLYARLSPSHLFGRRVPLAIRAGVKLPVGDFDVGSNFIPLGDGQRDWELIAEVGRSLYPRPFYLMGWVGYRWREDRDEGRLDFGNERFFYAAAGGTASVVDFKLALEGWYGDTPLFNAVLAEGGEREMLRLAPSLLIGAGPGQVELGARVPLAGRNLPAGTDVVIGYFTRFGGQPGG